MKSIFNIFFPAKNRLNNVAYGEHSAMRYNDYPASDDNAPIVIYWHGGGWTSGSKELYHAVGYRLQKMGAHTVITGYPLYPQQTFPGFIDDAQGLISHIQKKYPNRRIFLMGHSAGGHTALIAAMTGLHSLVTGVIALASPCNIAPKYRQVFGDVFGSSKQDPRSYVEKSDKAIKYLLLHGDHDKTVSVDDSISLNETLTADHIVSSTRVIKRVGHTGILILFVLNLSRTMRDSVSNFIFKD